MVILQIYLVSSGQTTLVLGGPALKFRAAAKVRFFDQVQEFDPVSLGLKLAVSFVQSFTMDIQITVCAALEIPTSYSLNPSTFVQVQSTKAGFVGQESRFGLGLGINLCFN
jgi:hypothetical protein